jgi:ABC-type amino acid transport substrate-binding protein
MPNDCRRSIRRRVLGAAFAGSLLLTARAGFAATITPIKPGVLKVCLYAGFKPFAWKEGNVWKGWDVNYLAAFAKENHLEFEPVEAKAFDGIWLRPGNDECDIAGTGISDTQERRKATEPKGKWSATYYKVVRAFLVRTADKDKVKDVVDLRGKTVIVTLGSTADNDLRNRMRQARITDVKIEGTDNEEKAADQIRKGPQFAYGGGYGSVLALATNGLAVVWPHCNMVEVGKDRFEPYAEPFSFVARAKSTGVLEALNSYIPKHKYEGTPNPPGVICQNPPWTGK